MTIRVLHFASIINDNDFIDAIAKRVDRSEIEVAALTCVEARRPTDGAAYPTRTLEIEVTYRNFGRLLGHLLAEIRRFRPQILHAHHYNESLIGAVAASIMRVPAFVIGHHYSDHIYYLTRGLKQKAFLALEGAANARARKVVVPAASVGDILRKQGVPEKKIAVISYGMDLDTYRTSSPGVGASLRAGHSLEGKFVALTCCRLSREKGLDHVLRAIPRVAAAHPDFRLVLLGDGPHRAELEALGASLGLGKKVEFLGWQDNALDWLSAADVVLQPSFCESFCQVLVEAAVFGKPMIMTPTGAAADIIGDNERGLLVPAGDAAAVAAALESLLADRTLAPKLGAAARAHVRKVVDATTITRQHTQMYRDALGL